jgi:DNA (cytosine-5)-methyltransferase 1
MRLGMQAAGGECVFSSEIDDFARATYFQNFGELPFGDIASIDHEDIPKHDVLVGGFPCQPFSIAGLQRGFRDRRGGLFFEVESILSTSRPRALLLENVGGLSSRKSSAALREILLRLKGRGYHCPEPRILNARHFGVPQNRARIFIVGFRSQAALKRFEYPEARRKQVNVGKILSTEPVDYRYYLSPRLLSTLEAHKSRHSKRGNGFGLQILDPDDVANAIVVGGMGHERNLIRDPLPTSQLRQHNLLDEINSEGIRRMTPFEWSQLQGYPKHFKFPVSDTQAYKQLGNSVAVPLIRALGNQIVLALGR